VLIVNDPSFMGEPGDVGALGGDPLQQLQTPTPRPVPPSPTPQLPPTSVPPPEPSMFQGWMLEICFTNGTRAYYSLGGR
jgi:hypothetical protein